MDILRDLIPEAKRAFRGSSENGLMRRTSEKSSITADTPVPFRIADLLALIDERIGRLEGRAEKPHLRALKGRVMSAINDPRYHFMFSSNTITDTILDTIARIFRIPGEGKPVTTFQLAGIPSEVLNSVASVLCRMAFEIGLWSNGGVHMLVVCEEAHRYVPADPKLSFTPIFMSDKAFIGFPSGVRNEKYEKYSNNYEIEPTLAHIFHKFCSIYAHKGLTSK